MVRFLCFVLNHQFCLFDGQNLALFMSVLVKFSFGSSSLIVVSRHRVIIAASKVFKSSGVVVLYLGLPG